MSDRLEAAAKVLYARRGPGAIPFEALLPSTQEAWRRDTREVIMAWQAGAPEVEADPHPIDCAVELWEHGLSGGE